MQSKGQFTWERIHGLHDDLLDEGPIALVGRQRRDVVAILHHPAGSIVRPQHPATTQHTHSKGTAETWLGEQDLITRAAMSRRSAALWQGVQWSVTSAYRFNRTLACNPAMPESGCQRGGAH